LALDRARSEGLELHRVAAYAQESCRAPRAIGPRFFILFAHSGRDGPVTWASRTSKYNATRAIPGQGPFFATSISSAGWGKLVNLGSLRASEPPGPREERWLGEGRGGVGGRKHPEQYLHLAFFRQLLISKGAGGRLRDVGNIA
jgi:hypothetical protein